MTNPLWRSGVLHKHICSCLVDLEVCLLELGWLEHVEARHHLIRVLTLICERLVGMRSLQALVLGFLNGVLKA